MTCVPGAKATRAERQHHHRAQPSGATIGRNRYRLQLTRKNVSNINTDHNGAL